VRRTTLSLRARFCWPGSFPRCFYTSVVTPPAISNNPNLFIKDQALCERPQVDWRSSHPLSIYCYVFEHPNSKLLTQR
jgi:hypothetical protein